MSPPPPFVLAKSSPVLSIKASICAVLSKSIIAKMSFQNYEGFPPQQNAENASVPSGPGAPGPQGQMQPIESTAGQFPQNPAGRDGEPLQDSKTTLWCVDAS
jgi:hypothetical protein